MLHAITPKFSPVIFFCDFIQHIIQKTKTVTLSQFNIAVKMHVYNISDKTKC